MTVCSTVVQLYIKNMYLYLIKFNYNVQLLDCSMIQRSERMQIIRSQINHP